MIPCKFCRSDCDPVESHIIPASFFRAIKSGLEPLKVMSTTSGVYPKRSHTGIYDRIMCLDCERRFSKFDDYGARLLLNYRSEFQPVYDPNGTLVAFSTKNYDYNLLKLFFISVLWRASVSKHSFFRRISLGPYEEQARLSIQHENPGDEHHFSTVLSCWNEKQERIHLHKVMLDPFERRWRGIRAVRLYLGELQADIKVDRRPVVDPMAKFVLRQGHDLRLITRDPSEGFELRAAQKLVNAPQNMA